MAIDLPSQPGLWLPPKPAIITRASAEDLALIRSARKEHRRASFPFPVFLPGGKAAVTGGYRNTYVDTTNSTNYTFSSADIGTAASNRYVVVAVMRNVSTTQVTSLTVAGQGSSKVAQDATSGARAVDFWRTDAAVTSGTTATVQVNKNGLNGFCAIAVWALYGIDPTPFATGGTGDTTDPIGMNLNTLAGGVVIAASCCTNYMETLSCAWTGLTENYDAVAENDGTWYYANSVATLLTTITETPRTVQADWTGSSLDSPRGCAVSFGPA